MHAGEQPWVELERSCFFPEGGGQPADQGWIDEIQVVDVQTHSGIVRHYVLKNNALPTVGQTVSLEIDWRRRFDLTQQHSGQHLLTAVALRDFGWETIGFSLGAQVSTIDLTVDSISPEQLDSLEDAVNSEIVNNLVFATRLCAREDLVSLGVRTRGVPETVSGPIRLVEIEGLDLNTCGGTHVSRTGELQSVALWKTERARGGTRLYFWFGGRVQRQLRIRIDRETKLNTALSQGPEEHAQTIAKWALERKSMSKEINALNRELAGLIGQSLDCPYGYGVLYRPDASMVMLQAIGQALQDRGITEIWLTGQGCFWISSEQSASSRTLILTTLDGRGGGRPPVIQGKCSKPFELETLMGNLFN